jgi:predicted SAM-dependent methyltransferase
VTIQHVLLNVGCGAIGPVDPLPSLFRSPGWGEVRLDIDPGVEPDIVASITDMSSIRSDSVDALWSSHNLEHLYDHDVGKAMAEFRRVLKPAGFVYLKVPDLQAVAEFMAANGAEKPAYESPAGPIAPLDMIYGLRTAIAAGHHYMAHRTGFTPHILERVLETAGFEFGVMKRKNYMELSAVAFKTAVNGPEGHARIMAELGF